MNLFVRDIYVFLFPPFFFGCPVCFWAINSNVRTIFLSQHLWAFNSNKIYIHVYLLTFLLPLVCSSLCLTLFIRMWFMLFACIFACLPLDSAYIRLGGISLLSHFLGDLHPFKGLSFGLVSNLHPSRRNIIT